MSTRVGALLLGVFLAGCGGGGSAPPKAISGPAKQAADTVQRLERATARQDFAAVCDDILAAATRKRAGGAQCAAVLAARARGVRDPHIDITSIEIERDQALVKVRTTATGQAATDDVIRLVREDGRYRVSSLAR